MARIATIEMATGSGTREVPVFELADVEYDALRVHTDNGVGAINLVDPADAELDELRVQTADGVKAVSNSVRKWIDTFEDGDLSEYSFDSDASTHIGTSSARTYEGSQSLRFAFDSDQTSGKIWSTSGLPASPSPGDTFEVRIFPNAFHDRSIRLEFGVQDSNDYYDLVARQWASSSNNDLRLRRIQSGNSTTLSESSLSVGDSTQWLRYVVEWGSGGSISGRVENSGGTVLASVSDTDTTFSDGGVGFGVYNGVGGSSSDPVYFDAARIR